MNYNYLLVLLIIFAVGINIGGIVANIKLMYDDSDCTLLCQIWTNGMNIFGRLLLTFICLALIPIWTIFEGLFRLLKWLCYLGKDRSDY